MVREDIVSGLKAALNRGQSMRQAAASFYNAGYNVVDVDNAIKFIEAQSNPQPLQASQPQQIQQPEQPVQKPVVKAPLPQQLVQQTTPQPPVQRPVSSPQPIIQKPTSKPQVSTPLPNISSQLISQELPQKQPVAPKVVQKVSKYGSEPEPQVSLYKKPTPVQRPKVVQKVSSYGAPKKPKNLVIFILIFILIVLLGLLAAALFFKSEIISFLS